MTYLEAVAAAGYATLTDPSTKIDPAAARMLMGDDEAVGLALAGDALLIALAQVPSPARVAQLEEATGLAVSLVITTPQILAALRTAASALPGGTPEQLVESALRAAAARNASDIVLATGALPAVRVAGAVAPLDGYPRLSAAQIAAAHAWLLGKGARRGVIAVADHRWRVNAVSTGGTLTLALRRLPATAARPEELGVPATLVSAAGARHGLVLIASGPGGGRTATAAALIDHINSTRPVHVVTIGDPSEYQHRSRRAIITEQRIGKDCATVADAVANAGAMSADVISMDIRTGDDARAALMSAVSGHLVIATVAAISTANALKHVVSLFAPAERAWAHQALSSTLRIATAQQILLSTEGAGKSSAVFEVLPATDAVRSLIAQDALEHIAATLEDNAGEAMSSMERSLALHVAAGRLDPATARQAAPNAARFDEHASSTLVIAAAQRIPTAAPERPLTAHTPVERQSAASPARATAPAASGRRSLPTQQSAPAAAAPTRSGRRQLG